MAATRTTHFKCGFQQILEFSALTSPRFLGDWRRQMRGRVDNGGLLRKDRLTSLSDEQRICAAFIIYTVHVNIVYTALFYVVVAGSTGKCGGKVRHRSSRAEPTFSFSY